MVTFADIPLRDVRTDCRHYTGYKPCHKADACPGCTHYAPRGAQVLVIKLAAMGDVLRTKSILPALRRAWPESWLVWLTDPGSEPIARDPLVDEIRAFTTEGLMALEGRAFEAVYCYDKEPHALALSAKVNAKRRFGYAPTAYNTVTVWNAGAEEALRLGLSDEFKFRISRKTMPHVVHDMAELPYDRADFSLVIRPEARAAAAARLAAIGLPVGLPVVGVNTGCGPAFPTKGLPQENMTGLVARLAASGDVNVLLLGGPREEPLHRAILAALPEAARVRVFDSGTGNALETFFAIVDRCDVVVSSDSLAMHVGTALRKPVIAFFGATCEHEVDMYGRGEKVVAEGFECSPCYRKSCPQPVFCLSTLTPERLEAAVRRWLPRG